MKRRTWVLLLFLATAIGVTWFRRQEIENSVKFFLEESIARFEPVKEQPFELLVGDDSVIEGDLSIPLQPMIDFDFKTKAQVYQLRQDAVLKYPDLVIPEYKPSESVFGAIEDKKPWWGIDGIYFFGNGEKSIAGPSEESRILLNPYLLVGVIEAKAYAVKGKPYFRGVFPRPLKLTWQPSESKVVVKYDVGSHFKFLVNKDYPAASERTLHFAAYNARDFGLNYLYIDVPASKNVVPKAGVGQVVELRQFIHCGGSCGYKGGCNNMSPTQNELLVTIPNLPAKAVLKLWHAKPDNPEQAADLDYSIEMV